MISLAPLLLAVPLFVFSPEDRPDLVVLASGKEVPCRVLFEDDERVIYKPGRKILEVSREEVTEVQSIERTMRTFLERYSALESTDVVALGELALWAESQDLPGEARNLWIRVLLNAPESEQAWTELGGSHGRRGWRLRVRGKYYTLAQLRERASLWKNAMELPTAHFLVKTNIDPLKALDVSIDIERIYHYYYDFVGQPLQLYPFEQIPELHVYGDTEDAPNPPQKTWTAWYERVGNAVLVRGSGADRHEILKSIAYLMLTNSSRLTKGGDRVGVFPEWVREGLANSLAFAVRTNPGKLTVETGVAHQEWFEAQANDAEPVKLKRLLDAGRGEFRTGKEEARYRRQAYTFVFFMANARDGEYHDRFHEYLRTIFEGKGSPKDLERIAGVDLETLEGEWYAYVREVAGKQ